MSYLDDLIQTAMNAVDSADDAVDVLTAHLDEIDEAAPLTDEQRAALAYLAETSQNTADKLSPWVQG